MLINTINPILASLGPFQIRWYGVLLGAGVLLCAWLLARVFREQGHSPELALDILLWLAVGGFIGARLGHVFFYRAEYFLANPIEILYVHQGGLSSHGLTLGLLATAFLYSKIKRMSIWRYADLLVLPIPLLAALIRIANFTNSEIVGRPTDGSWGVLFPLYEANPVPRHPSQLYESAIALAIFGIVFFTYKKYGKRLPQYFILHLFLLLYFSTRFLVEFVKEYPLTYGLTTGQWLSIPFVLWGLGWFVLRRKLNNRQA